MRTITWKDASAEEAARQDAVIDQLRLADLHYLGGGTRRRPRTWPLTVLLQSLVSSSEPRLRLALVALLLRHPVLAEQTEKLAGEVADAALARGLRTSILAAAALQRVWAFSLDLYQPGWQPIESATLARELQVSPPEDDFGRTTLRDLAYLLADDDPLAPDYVGAWEDVGRHVIDGLRTEECRHGT